MLYPGQRVQVDVKVVPTACIVGDAKGERFYQYTAIDEYSRFRYIEAFREQNTYSSKVFLSVYRPIMALSLPRSLAAARSQKI